MQRKHHSLKLMIIILALKINSIMSFQTLFHNKDILKIIEVYKMIQVELYSVCEENEEK